MFTLLRRVFLPEHVLMGSHPRFLTGRVSDVLAWSRKTIKPFTLSKG